MLKLSGCCLYTHSTVIDGVMSIIHSSFTLESYSPKHLIFFILSYPLLQYKNKKKQYW